MIKTSSVSGGGTQAAGTPEALEELKAGITEAADGDDGSCCPAAASDLPAAWSSPACPAWLPVWTPRLPAWITWHAVAEGDVSTAEAAWERTRPRIQETLPFALRVRACLRQICSPNVSCNSNCRSIPWGAQGQGSKA